jgi:aspartate/glutamate racemase
VGLLGTTITMGTSLYRAPLEEKGIKVLIPSESDRGWIGNAISNDFQRQSIPIASLDKPETNNGFA